MLKINIIKRYYKTITVAIVIMILSLMPINNTSESTLLNLPHLDKIVHIIIYMSLTFFLLIEGLGNKKNLYPYLITAILLSVFYGGFIELIQLFLPARSGDFLDIAANFTGSLLAIPLYKLYYRFR